MKSVTDISDAQEVTALVAQLTGSLESSRDNHANRLTNVYQTHCAALDVDPQEILLTEKEELYRRKVPRKLYPVYTEDYKTRNENVQKNIPRRSPRMPYLARFEVPILIDGNRSILEIYHIVRAAYGFVNRSSDEFKYAYVIAPNAPDVKLQSVIDYITAMEKAGLVEIEEK